MSANIDECFYDMLLQIASTELAERKKNEYISHEFLPVAVQCKKRQRERERVKSNPLSFWIGIERWHLI